MAHLCGLCLTLRDRHGQLSRVTTNRDAVVLSVLYEAQAGPAMRVRAGPCPLRGLRPAGVAHSGGVGVRFAAAITLLLAAAAIDDKVADGELRPAVATDPARRLADRWRRDALRDAAEAGFDGTVILDLVERQAALEATPRLTFDDYAGPTERSVGAAFRHTAVLAGRPANADGLEAAGRLFGRIAYLLDAVEDRERDRRHGRFNGLDAASPEVDAPDLFRTAHAELRTHLDAVDLREPRLVRSLLVDGLARAGRRVLPAATNAAQKPPRWVTALLAGWAGTVGLCGTCYLCANACEHACDHACDRACDQACDQTCSGCNCNC